MNYKSFDHIRLHLPLADPLSHFPRPYSLFAAETIEAMAAYVS